MRLTPILAASILLGWSSSGLAAAGLPALDPPRNPNTAVVHVAFSSTIYDIQRALKAAGYTVGRADGLMGRQIRDAIQKYQRDRNLLETGEPSVVLLDHIRKNSPAVQQPDPPPPPAQTPEPPGDPKLRALQKDLRYLGYTAAVTGDLDAPTHTAIRDYQRDRKLLVTGEYHPALVRHVRKAADEEERKRAQVAQPHRPASRQTISATQQQLRQRGYPISNIFGDWDNATESAIRSYQRDHDISETGLPTNTLAQRLRETSAADLSRARVLEVQTALNKRGYNAGSPDGLLGPTTRAAIAQYRGDNGMEPIGAIAPNVLASLRRPTSNRPSGTNNGWGNRPDRDQPPSSTRPRTKFEVRLRDDFDDGDLTRNPAWHVARGRFSIENGAMFSSVTPVSRHQSSDAGNVIGNILGEALGVQIVKPSHFAAIALPMPFDGAFRVRMRLQGSSSTGGSVDFGAYTGRSSGTG